MVHHATKIIAGIAFLLLLAAVGGFFGFSYFISTYEQKILDERIAFVESVQQREALTTLSTILTDTELDRKVLRSYILTEDQIIDFLSLVEGFGPKTGTEITTSGLAEVVGTEAYDALDISVSAKGSYVSATRVLRLLEILPYHSRILQTSLNREGTEGDVWTMTVTVQVAKYKTS